ncbi:SGNH/GDSL hydrolase family protein [Bacteroides sp. OttesenSCG-928-E20]|nr:SGNH/GDSL hydrolase family protein [Bacteroides sp. OttesenSCG-928-N06]MDL2299884.1 SGNH/GDSL hydrolase family protein [Bacteroides sp. OttesenSCG-928-E20]MDL2306186.1 SGNH/GDSL hydrolase family protein [Bacteroides sp. OttesenSCG-928-D19]
MKTSKIACLLYTLFIYSTTAVFAQDALPVPPPCDVPAAKIEEAKMHKTAPDSIVVSIALPDCFAELLPNEITDPAEVLQPVLEHLRLMRLGVTTDTLRILHIGDSHVRGRIFPNTVGQRLTDDFGAIAYTNLGVNGATCLTFTHPARIDAIAEAAPHLIILSFGTNESHNRRYNANAHYHQMDELVTLIRNRLPGVPMLMSTPPGSYESFRQRNRRRTYTINPRTVTAVETIHAYATNHQLAVWDMYTNLGGCKRACLNWQEAGLMRPDHVHYLPEAYVLQGELLYQAIINAYNAYVSF